MGRFGLKNMFFGQTFLTDFTEIIDFPMPLITTVSKMLIGHPSAIHFISGNIVVCKYHIVVNVVCKYYVVWLGPWGQIQQYLF